MDKIAFLTEDGSEQEFYVLDRTKLNGAYYLLVAEEMEETQDAEVEVLILKETQSKDGQVLTYEIVEDEIEISCVCSLFEENIEMEELST